MVNLAELALNLSARIRLNEVIRFDHNARRGLVGERRHWESFVVDEHLKSRIIKQQLKIQSLCIKI